MDAGLQIAIQVFIWIQFWRIRRQIEDFDLLLFPCQPVLDLFSVVNPQVVQNQNHLALHTLRAKDPACPHEHPRFLQSLLGSFPARES